MLCAKNLKKTFPLPNKGMFRALDGVDLEVAKGEFFTLLGPSGCGKTTTLRCIAGLEYPDTGSITIGANRVFDSARTISVPANRRNIGMVFQSYAIWPHMNVFDNVAFPLTVGKKRASKRVISENVGRVLATVQLTGFEERSATKLSGGQQQRLALARALVVEPDILLLDEPLSNLDAKLRETMRFELRRLQRDLGITTIYVTHDQGEALAMSDQIAVMQEGRIEQLGTPESIYERPATRFVATFIGSTNLLSASVSEAPDSAALGIAETGVGPLRCTFSEGATGQSEIVVSLRPESFVMSDAANAGTSDHSSNRLTGHVTEKAFLGDVIDYAIMVQQTQFRVRGSPQRAFDPGDEVCLEIKPTDCLALPPGSGKH